LFRASKSLQVRAVLGILAARATHDWMVCKAAARPNIVRSSCPPQSLDAAGGGTDKHRVAVVEGATVRPPQKITGAGLRYCRAPQISETLRITALVPGI
jgi:hypothetical protein